MEKALEAAKNLHQADVKKGEEVTYEDIVGNNQIK
jgi:hypothetical protein